MEDLTGKQLDQYRIVAPLGEGGMAAVYKAFQPSMERYVAIKILPRHYAADPNFIGRFEQEAKVIASLQHPNILPVHDYGKADGYTYLVMRYIEGGTLADLLQGQPLPMLKIYHIISQIGDALDYAHSRGVVHRDVKPSNVLIDERGNCLLTDFGIAKMIEATAQFTVTGTFVGTPTYASPEQGLGLDLDRRSDIYSLGVVLYEMATGRPPFDAETPMAIVVKHIHDPLPLPRTINPTLPQAVERVILKALAKKPEDRYQTVGEIVRALTAVGREEAALPEPEPQPAAVPRLQPERGRRIPTWGWILGGLVALGVLVGLLVGGVKPFGIALDVTPTPTNTPTPVLPTVTLTLANTPTPVPPTATLTSITPPGPTSVPTETPTATPTAVLSTATPTATPSTRIGQEWVNLRSFPSPGAGPSGIVRVADNLWIAVPCDDRIYRLNLEGDIVAELEMPKPGCGPHEVGLAWDGESLWGAWWNRVVQLNPNTGQTLAEFHVDLDKVRGIAWDGSALWMIDGGGNLARYDRAGQRLRRLAIPVSGGLAWVEGELWVVDIFGKLTRFDSEFVQVGSFSLSQCGAGPSPYHLALYWDRESLWLADSEQNRILQCAPAD